RALRFAGNRIGPGVRSDGRRHEADWTFAPDPGQLIDAIEVATHAEPTVATKLPVAIEHGKTRQLDRQTFTTVVHGPQDRDAAPGLARGHSTRDLAVGIEFEVGGDLAP